MTKALSVMLTTEGTYPHSTGGVSTWCNNLIGNLNWVDFTLVPVMMNPYITMRYELAGNIDRVAEVPLWGMEEPAEYLTNIPFSQVYQAKRETLEPVISDKFIPSFRAFVEELYQDKLDGRIIGEKIYEMHRYFQRYDYNLTLKSEPVWDTFREVVLSNAGRSGIAALPTIFDITEALRWLYHFMIPVLADPPRTDLAHSTAAAFCAIPCVVSKLRDGTPFLLTEHGVYIREQYLSVSRANYPFYAKDFLLRLIVGISRMSYFFADQISPVCRYNIRWEMAHGAEPEKIKVIYNGIDPDVFVSRELPDLPPTVIVPAARIDPLKDIETLLHAAARVSRSVPDIAFVVYGHMLDEDYLNTCTKLRQELGLEHTVTFAGHSDVPWEIYNQGHVVALTSISEAFPYAVIEAMASSRPVVASNVGGIGEALEGCGIVVAPRDVEGFANAILKLLGDPELRKQLGQEARDRVLNTFTLRHFVTAYGDSYRTLTSAGDAT